MPGIGVSLFPSYYFGITDSTGSVEIKDLLPGPYEVTMTDPRLAELGIGAPAQFGFSARRDSTIATTIRVRPAELVVADRCTYAPSAMRPDSVFVFGRVLNHDGKPVSGAKVTFAGQDRGAWESRTDYVVTGNDGVFQSCRNWNVGDHVRISVQREGVRDLVLTRRFESSVLAVKVVVQPDP